jgi:5-methyltetrahydrofolate--homocysteine methyltransferase
MAKGMNAAPAPGGFAVRSEELCSRGTRAHRRGEIGSREGAVHPRSWEAIADGRIRMTTTHRLPVGGRRSAFDASPRGLLCLQKGRARLMSLTPRYRTSSVCDPEQFLAWLKSGPRVGDGAMGTMLQRAGLPLEGCPEAWNLERPGEVRAVHAAYREAGAELLQTNSFGGNWFRLGRVGLGDRVAEVNAAAVRLAREAGGPEGPRIAGTIGPVVAWRESGGTLSRAAASSPLVPLEEALAEQSGALAAAGVDLFLIETMPELAEALMALKAARTQALLPVVVTLAFGRDGRTVAGGEPPEVAALLVEAGAAAVGANCGAPTELLPVIRQMRAALPEIPLVVQPSAGLPRLVDGQPVYEIGPGAMGVWARRLVEAGADLVGGCCGTTPAHIRAIREALHAG